jgi:ribosomal protein S18 acetylase RimI-like enzyme
MTALVEYRLNQASAAEIAEHLLRCDDDFMRLLRARVEIAVYAAKLKRQAMTFEAWSGGTLAGLVAAYCNDHTNRLAYITSVSVLKAWRSKGIALHLMRQCIDHASSSGMRRIGLEVAHGNVAAVKLYEDCGFVVTDGDASFVGMNLYLGSGEEHEEQA